MMDYILKLKTLVDNLAAIGEPVTNRDHILQLLGGLGADYNSIVASLTTREDEVSLHSVHTILLTHEQCLESSKLSCRRPYYLCQPHWHIIASQQ